ncbi:MAG: trigger factor, partial [Acidobacteriota bacterium]
TSQAELKITAAPEDFKPFLEKAAAKLSETHPSKGFRPGKLPVKMAAEAYGTEALLQEAADRAVPHFFVEAAVEHNLEAINRPSISIEHIGLDAPLSFTATVDVLPAVTIGDPALLKVERRPVEVKDEHVEQELTYIAKMRGSFIDVARPAEKGDTVTVDFAVHVNGAVIEGGESKNHPVTLGDGHFVPDFEKGLTGIESGQERTFSMTFPADYPKQDLQNQVAEVHVTAHSVQKRVLPAINDEFARGLGDFKDVADLKRKLRENIRHELVHKEEDRVLGEVAENFAEQTQFGHIPTILVEKEIDRRLQELSEMLAVQQKTIGDYLHQNEKTIDEVREAMREVADKHVKIGLALRAFARQEDITVTKEEIEEEAVRQLQQYGDIEEAKKNINPEELREYVESMIRNRKTLKRLAEMAENKQ